MRSINRLRRKQEESPAEAPHAVAIPISSAHAVAPSTLRYDGAEAGEEDGEGVAAREVVDLCCYLASPAGSALNGATLRAYGNA